jgi:hypothetical protein
MDAIILMFAHDVSIRIAAVAIRAGEKIPASVVIPCEPHD